LVVAISPARAGDHIAIFDLLQHIFQGPSAAEFHAAQDDPVYQPCDRLVARSGTRLLGHVHLVEREMKFGALTLPVTDLQHLGVLPEFRGQGVGDALLREAETQMLDNGTKIGFLRTSTPQFFAKRGWIVCGRNSYSVATARDILARLASSAPSISSSPLAPAETPLVTRLWRQVEQEALGRIYDENTRGAYGPLVRNHVYWRWLFSRHSYDRIYVTIEGSGRLELDEGTSRIVGYAIERTGWILELMTAPGHPQAGRALLARACSDAIERNDASVRFDGPLRHPLHKLMLAAGGRRDTDGMHVTMAKVFDPLALVDQMRGELAARVKSHSNLLPLELGFLLDDEKHQLVVTRRGARLLHGKSGRSYITCSTPALARLALGQTSIAQEESAGRIEASTRTAIELGSLLFPLLDFWRPPLDQLSAR
jgi:putative acetyltransferase